ncbi:MAG: 23S rRNA (guanosine(2251)-2'-O)-methyltransferase RlmB [Candidatus Eremiobacteraeota bacterium]|nr:23S rRNA (guanosine(2251)-2'-O)-methyltransferase RlmB [Candidatus Eremiobacteraeota bacterium]
MAHEEIIYGLHAVDEALRAGEPVRRLVIGRQRQADPKVKPLIDAARARRIPVSFDSGPAFSALQGRNHQHVLASMEPFAYAAWSEVRSAVRAAEQILVLVLDHLEDPQNAGAILRNAEGAGVGAVILPERRSVGVTAAVRRAAAGAASHLHVCRVPNIASALQSLKDDGCWVTGLSLADTALPYDRADFAPKTALVVGSEGNGLSRLVAERCDLLVHIPLRGRVLSLNAASAAAVVLFEIARRHNDAGYQNQLVTPQNKAKPRPNP